MTRGFVAATLAGMLTIAVAGSLLYGVVLAEFFRANVGLEAMRDPPWGGVLTPQGGTVTGGTLGFLMATGYNLAQFGTTTHWTLRLTLIEPFITMVMVAAAGAVVAMVLRRSEPHRWPRAKPLSRASMGIGCPVLVIAAAGLAACGGGSSAGEQREGTRLVFRDAAGRELTTDDLKGASGTVRWEVIGADAIPAEAARLHEEAREAGGRGDYPRALDLLEEAHRLAPDWPYPVYDAAFTYLLQGDSKRAEEHYAEVDRMAPRGFFTAKTSLDCLRRERAGMVPPEFFRAFVTLESMGDEAQKRTRLEEIVERLPTFPPVWKELSMLLDDEEARLQAVTRGLEHGPDPETKGILLVNRAMILHRRGDRDAAVKILGELALDPQSTLSTEMLAKAALVQIGR